MQLKDIAICVASAQEDAGALDLAQALAAKTGAHVACSAIGIMPAPILYNEFGMGAAYVEQLNQDKELVDRFWTDLQKMLEKKDLRCELRRHRTYGTNLESLVATIARHADLTIIRAPAKDILQPHAQMIEAALLGSGRPVMVAPVNWKPGPVGKQIVVGWDASREAARAVHDALLVADEGADITVVTVDAKAGSLDHGDAPGLDIAAHLARHGHKVTLRNEGSLGRSAHEVILQVAMDKNADMIVLGGYRHARLQQALFGGMTRSMLRDVKLPLLLSH